VQAFEVPNTGDCAELVREGFVVVEINDLYLWGPEWNRIPAIQASSWYNFEAFLVLSKLYTISQAR
jgi:hypothetical protein